MQAMVGLPGVRRLLLVLATNLMFLLACALTFLLVLSAMGDSPGGYSQIVALAVALLLTGIAVVSMAVAIDALNEPIELLLSINAKKRLARLVLPSLILAGALCFGDVLLAIGLTWYAAQDAPVAYWSVVTIGGVAFLIPLLALTYFAAGVLKRYILMRRGAARMTSLLDGAHNEPTASLHRLRASVATELGTATTNVRPNPQGFNLGGITSRPYHDPVDFSWMRAFEDQYKEILEEAETVLRLHASRVDIYKYPGLDGQQWKAFNFVSRHKPNDANMALCPVTTALLKEVPRYPIFRDAMFSILAPGAEIARHRDVANIYLTAHLGLLTPEDSFLEVAGGKRPWSAGKFQVFDSSYEHRAVNSSSLPRVVLLIDFLHPEINDEECNWIEQMRL